MPVQKNWDYLFVLMSCCLTYVKQEFITFSVTVWSVSPFYCWKGWWSMLRSRRCWHKN